MGFTRHHPSPVTLRGKIVAKKGNKKPAFVAGIVRGDGSRLRHLHSLKPVRALGRS